MTPVALADLFLSGTALAGLAVLHRAVRARGPREPLNRRFLFGIRVTGLLYLARAGAALLGGWVWGVLELAAAALIPLAALVLAEGLLRRHAPPVVKALALGGTALFLVLALFPEPWVEPARLAGVLAYQLAMFLGIGWLIASRDRASLSAAENVAVVRLALSLLVMVPLGAADFRPEAWGLAVQPSALAVLVLCRLALSLGREEDAHRAALAALGIVTALALVTAWVLTGVTSGPGLTIAAVVLAAALLADVLLAGWGDGGSQSLLSVLDGPGDVATRLLAHPFGQGGARIAAQSLADLDGALLDQVFAAHPVIRRAALPALSAQAAEHLEHLFAVTGASHLMAVGQAPLSLLALVVPPLALTPRVEAELMAVQRLAMAEGRHGPGRV